METRRVFLGTLVSAGIGLGGCTSARSGAGTAADIVAGPDSRLTFDPTELVVSPGETVTWVFDSSGHNVSAVPEHSESVSIPGGTEPFSSYDDAQHRTMSPGETFSHRFEIPGTYEYVCIPHESAGMVGKIQVTE